jgi:hypothetical protein
MLGIHIYMAEANVVERDLASFAVIGTFSPQSEQHHRLTLLPCTPLDWQS